MRTEKRGHVALSSGSSVTSLFCDVLTRTHIKKHCEQDFELEARFCLII